MKKLVDIYEKNECVNCENKISFVEILKTHMDLPFLMDKLNTASADTGMVQGFVRGPLRAAHTTDIR